MKSLGSLPDVIVEANGARLDRRDLLALGEVLVQQKLSLPAQCELVFRQPPGPLPADSRLAIGTALRVAVRGQQVALFEGEVTAVERSYGPHGAQALRVRGYDRLHRLRKQAPLRAHADIALADLARELVGPLALAVQADDSGPVWSHVIQHRQSDLDLLRELAERSGQFFALRQSTLHLFTLEGIGEVLDLALGDSLLEARFEANAELACDQIEARGWDAEHVERHSGQADVGRSGRDVRTQVAPSAIGAGTRFLVDLRLENAQQAELAAQSALDRRSAREVVVTGVAEGDTRLRPGTPVDIDGVAAGLRGRYVATQVIHRIDERAGFISEFSSTPPPPGDRADGTMATVGIVGHIDDPERLGRVRVTLPTLGDVTTGWIHVVSAGAGGGKGLMILPDVGDEVLVLASQSDPAQAVVVGGLYGAGGAPDSGIEDGAVRRFTLLTPGGQRVQLDDARGSLRVENRDGSFVELTPERVRVHAAADLEIEAPGRAIVVRGNTIDFQRG